MGKTTMEWVFDIQENDIFWCTADIGWITGHTYSVYGPLSSGATAVMFEGVPTHPDSGRCWEIIEKYKINQFYTTPTLIRMLHKMGANNPTEYDLSSLRILGTVAEPIDETAWNWYYETVGKDKCTIVDTYWQTETGGHVVAPIASITPIKPSSATLPLPGIIVEVINEFGALTKVGEKGLLCIVKPWASMIRDIWGDSERLISTYFRECKKDNLPVYFTGDGAIIDEDVYIFITGELMML